MTAPYLVRRMPYTSMADARRRARRANLIELQVLIRDTSAMVSQLRAKNQPTVKNGRKP